MTRAYRVLRGQPGSAAGHVDLPAALEALASAGYFFSPPGTQEASATLIRHTWLEEDQKAVVILVDDFEVPAQYVIVEADTPQNVTKVVAVVESSVAVYTLDQLKEEARLFADNNPGALVRLALGSPKSPDRSVELVLMDGLRQPNDWVRFEAVAAAALTRWPAMLAQLESMATSDPDEEVRGRAAVLLRTSSAQGAESST